MISFIVLLISRSVNFAGAAPATSVILNEAQISQAFTLEELDHAVLGLSESMLGRTWCGATEESAKMMMLPLRPILESRIKKESRRGLSLAMQTKIKNCRKTCNCGLYLDLVLKQKKPSSALVEILKKGSLGLSDSEKQECTKNASKLCKSPLLPSLMSIGKKDYSAEGHF
jgi:hypothetical protein